MMERDQSISKDTQHRIIEAAREMRQFPTRAEALLWEELRRKQLSGFKFRRQHIIYLFIVDFYCSEAKLVIEIDGGIHKAQADYDQYREDVLLTMGYKVLRFTNEEVMGKMSMVLGEIMKNLSES
jgi:leucyl-tRNA synthetase